MARVGIDETTGQLLYGWAHCKQSIRTILFTALNERVQRRAFGSELPSLIDKPQNMEFVIDIYQAVATSLESRVIEGNQMGEPGFVVMQNRLDAREAGRVTMHLGGVFFENGHLGDFSNPSVQSVTYAVAEIGSGLSIEVV